MVVTLHTPVSEVSRSYKTYSSRLEKLGIFTLQDFLYHIPSRYEDFSLISKIGSLQAGEVVTIRGQLVGIKNEYTRSFKKLQKGLVADETGSIELVWFNQPYLTKYLNPNDTVSLSGRVGMFGHTLVMESPEYEILNGENPQTLHTGRLVPIYPETRGVSSKWLRRQIYGILSSHKDEIVDFLPDELRLRDGLYSLYEALFQIHFPDTLENSQKARERLGFDELFVLQLASLFRREEWKKKIKGQAFEVEKYKNKLDEFEKSLPFQLTTAQNEAVSHILSDVTKEQPMNRLLQGDVGSGKTIVAAVASLTAFLNGFQSVFMAPTEILAQQHFATLSNFLSPFGMKVNLVTSSQKLTSKKPAHNSSSILHNSTDTDLLVGTHAVLSKNITFDRLGLVVIDEQQRFGVEQRSIIREKGTNPHLLSMTATPIPRTIALTLYGDLDLSYLNELPKGRKLIRTWLVPEEKRNGAYDWIRKQLKEHNSQAFIICPFIEESENMQTVKAASVEFDRLQKEVYPDLKLGLLHGKLKAKEKDQVLSDFRDKKYDILVATPVVEVGIDIPNATIILIEASERFGLAQLHQLRGRVGRGDKQSYCLLFTSATSPKTITRLKAMETSQIGAELAELDLKLRGPGELYGTAQSGVRQLKIASFSDFPLIQKARDEAKLYLPKLSEYPALQEKVKEITIQKVSPD